MGFSPEKCTCHFTQALGLRGDRHEALTVAFTSQAHFFQLEFKYTSLLLTVQVTPH